MAHRYQFLYDTLMTQIKDLDSSVLDNLSEEKIPLLDSNGYDIMYQLYDMFMKKHNLPLKKFIVHEEEDSNDFDFVTLDFINMPVQLKGLLYIFAETHFREFLMV